MCANRHARLPHRRGSPGAAWKVFLSRSLEDYDVHVACRYRGGVMIKYMLLIASMAIALTAATAARSDSDDVLIYLELHNGFSKQVHFTVDGRYSCDAQAHGAGKTSPDTCVFATACLAYDETFMFHEGSDGTCK